MTADQGRLSTATIELRVTSLSDRDRKILLDLARLRVLTGNHLARLHFNYLLSGSRDRTRRRVLSRLAALGFVTTLERQIGGVRAGSMGLIYALSAGGQRAMSLVAADAGLVLPTRARNPWTPGASFLSHTLLVSELYVRLIESQRIGTLTVGAYLAEPTSWFPNGVGGVLKPDAFAVVQFGDVEDSWAVEVDRGTESLPTLRHKLLSYVDFAASGQVGPAGVTPLVLVTVPHEQRLARVRSLVDDLPEPAGQLLRIALFSDSVEVMAAVLKE